MYIIEIGCLDYVPGIKKKKSKVMLYFVASRANNGDIKKVLMDG